MESVLDFIILFHCFQLRLHVSPPTRLGHPDTITVDFQGIFINFTRCSSGSKIGIEDHLRHSIYFTYSKRKFYNVGFCVVDFIYSWNIFHVHQVTYFNPLQSAACKNSKGVLSLNISTTQLNEFYVNSSWRIFGGFCLCFCGGLSRSIGMTKYREIKTLVHAENIVFWHAVQSCMINIPG